MATLELRPNGTSVSQGWTIGGGAPSRHAATSDDTDATYVQAAPGGWLLSFDLGAASLPEYAQIRAVAVRVRRVGNSLERLDVAIGYQPTIGDYQSQILATGDVPTSTIATKTYGSLIAAPGGEPWSETILDALQISFGASGTPLRIHEVYADVIYDLAPTVVVTAPVGLAGSQQPTITVTYTDEDDSPLERLEARIYTAAQAAAPGHSADTDPTYWDSGEVLTSQPSLRVDQALPAGSYVLYVRASDAGSQGRFGPWASATFTVSAEGLPATPSMSVEVDSDHRRVAVTVTPHDNLLTYGQSTGATVDDEGDGWYADDLSNSSVDSISTDASPTATIAETFTGANGALSGANTDTAWTVVTGAFAVASNQLTSSTSSANTWVRNDLDLGSPDHYAEMTINAMASAANRTTMLLLRGDASAITGYVAEIKEQTDTYAIWRVQAGTFAHGITGWKALPGPLTLPAVWRAEIRGNEISVYLDGVLLGTHALDGVVTAGNHVGIGMYNSASNILVDDFAAGDLQAVVSGTEAGRWLVRATSLDGRQVRATSGSRYGWGTPAIGGEIVTIRAAAWQSDDDARDARADVEWYGSDDSPLTNVLFEETWDGDLVPWDADWVFTFTGDAQIRDGWGALITGTGAYTTPSRMYCDGMPVMTDCEVLVKVRLSSTSAEMRAIIGVRTDGTWSGLAPNHPQRGYWVEVDSQNSILLIRKGGSTVLFTPGKTVPSQGLWVRLRAQGTTICAKAWPIYEQEPLVWDWCGEDSDYASGKISLTAQNGADAVSRIAYFDDLTADDLSQHSFGPTFETATDGSLTYHRRNAIVPAGAAYGKMSLIGFADAGGEEFLWSYMGIFPGSNRDWSRGGLGVANVYSANESSFEDPALGQAGWTASDDATVTRGSGYAAAGSGCALELAWSGSSSVGEIHAIGPAKPAGPGEDWAVGGWLWRASGMVTLLRIGLRFEDATGGVLATTFGQNVLPDVDVEFRDGEHTARAPVGTANVRAVVVATPVATLAAAVTAVRVVPGTVVPPVYQQGPSARSYALVTYSDDGGQTWAELRGSRQAYYPSETSRAVVVYDYTAPPGRARLYRAQTGAVDYTSDSAGAEAASAPSAAVAATLPADRFWLRDALTPARLIELWHAGDLDQTDSLPQQIHSTLGRRNPVVVGDVVKGETWTWPLVFTSDAAWRQFCEIRDVANVLIFTTDFGDVWHVSLGDTRRALLLRSSDRATTPIREIEITAVEVDPPDLDESADNIVTDLVWEIV